MDKSVSGATLDDVPLLNTVLRSPYLTAQNKAVLGLVLMRYYNFGHDLPVSITDEEFARVTQSGSRAEAVIYRRWCEQSRLLNRVELEGENHFSPNYFGIKEFLRYHKENHPNGKV